MKIFLLTIAALTCFAFNSILCRLALGGGAIDAYGFTLVRLSSGAVTLYFLALAGNDIPGRRSTRSFTAGNWISAFFLFLYAITFSFAYLGLTTGTGALILFGFVQATMIASAVARGERPKAMEWIGLFIALGGLVYLVLPGLESPPLLSSLLMATAGIAWGFYTLRGKTSASPVSETTGNFLRTLPFLAVPGVYYIARVGGSLEGYLFAALSGAIASGMGYTLWYMALRGHTATSAAVVQLSVPVIAAIGGVVFVSEAISFRLAASSALILGGIGTAIYGRSAVS